MVKTHHLLLGYAIAITILFVWMAYRTFSLEAEAAEIGGPVGAIMDEQTRFPGEPAKVNWRVIRYPQELEILCGKSDATGLNEFWQDPSGRFRFYFRANGDLQVQGALPTRSTKPYHGW